MPLGFIRVGDRYWLHDGGWWTVTLMFEPSSWAEGAYGEVALQCFLTGGGGYIPGAVDSPRLRANYKGDVAAFEEEFRELVAQLLPIALDLVNRIRTPQHLLGHLESRSALKHPRFYEGMLFALSDRPIEARKVLTAVAQRPPSNEAARLGQLQAAFALKLMSEPQLLRDYAEILIRSAREEVFPGTFERELISFPWE